MIALVAVLVNVFFSVLYKEACGKHTKTILDVIFALTFIILGLVGMITMDGDPIIKAIAETTKVDSSTLRKSKELRVFLAQAETGWNFEDGHTILFESPDDRMDTVEWYRMGL